MGKFLLEMFRKVLKFVPRILDLFGGLKRTNTSPHQVEQMLPVEPPNLEWMLPETEHKKLAVVGMKHGEVINNYLWYELGDIDHLKDEEYFDIIRAFFVNKKVAFGDIELRRVRGIPGNPVVLRLRGKLRLLTGVKLRGRYCALYQVGYREWLGFPMHGCVNFHVMWNEPPKEGIRIRPH